MHILVLDTVHGGDIIAGSMLKKGHTLTCVDVYGIASDDIMDDLEEKGAITSRLTVPKCHYEMVIMPIHCPDRFLEGVTWDSRMTFHQAVGELIRDERFRIEVTGVKGKTSLCYLLAHMLATSGMGVFLHTSRGQGPWDHGVHDIQRKVSIAPTSLLTLPSGDYDVMICESSLGGSGKADISVITNLADDYGIAEDSKKASDAKSNIFSSGTNIVRSDEIGLWKRYGKNLTAYGGKVQILNDPEIGKDLRISVEYDGHHEVSLKGSYIPLQYIETIEAAVEVCVAMKIPHEDVINALESFEGVPGRGELMFINGRWNVKERNPGISYVSISHTLDVLEKMDIRNYHVIIDPVNRKVCEKMDTEKISKMLSERGATYSIAENGEHSEVPKDTTVVIEFVKEGYQ